MSVRKQLQHGIYRVINPVVKLLIRWGLTPNMVTTIGLVLNIAVAVIFIAGAEESVRGDLSYVGWAGALILFAGLFDMLDGQVARLGNMSSRFGAMYDSVLDRYSELILFFGICYYLVAKHYFFSSILAFIAMIGSMMVSYTRARAEGLGIECKDGLMQRPERVVLIGVAAIACGITGHYIGGNYKLFVKGIPFHVFETMSIFIIPIAVLAVLSNVTAIGRLRNAKKTLDKIEGPKLKRQKAKAPLLMLALFCLIGMSTQANIRPHVTVDTTQHSEADTFPIPPKSAKHLFYLQRSPNTNTIICELNLEKNGQLNKDEPVHVFWIRYTEHGQPKELNFIQRVFAYGIKSTAIGNDSYLLHFVSYKKYQFTLQRSPKDNKYHVYANIQQKKAILNRVFIKINGGSMWSPNVEYIEVKGIDPDTNRELVERMKVS